MEPAPALETDINAETYPFARALELLDDALILPLYATSRMHADGLPPGQDRSPNPSFFELQSELRHFSMTVGGESAHAFSTENVAGEVVGHFRQQLFFVPESYQARPGESPPGTPFLPRLSQRFVLPEGIWRLGTGQASLRAFGTGRTYPRSAGSVGDVLFGAVQTVMEGEETFAGCRGTITWCGTFDPQTGFRGAVIARLYGCARIASSASRIGPRVRSELHLDPAVSYFLIRGQKPSSEEKTRIRFGADGQPSGLLVHQDLHAVDCEFSLGAAGEITRYFNVGAKLGTMDSEVFFNPLNPGAPGTNEAPVAFQSRNEIAFGRAGAAPHSTLQVLGRDEGRSFQLAFPEAPGQQALRFGIIGPTCGGTGFFQGKESLLMDNSAVTVAPHAVSTLYVLRVEPASTSGTAGFKPDGEPAAAASVADQTAFFLAEPYLGLFHNLNRNADLYHQWRNDFALHPRAFAEAIAMEYNSRIKVGRFRAIPLNPNFIASAFLAPPAPFNPEVFHRYGGPAVATFYSYRIDGGQETGQPDTLYSVWAPEALQSQGWYAKRISGSALRYFHPHEISDTSSLAVDLTLNAYRSDIGVVSWIEMFQRGHMHRSAIAYKMPGPHEVLWFVKEIPSVEPITGFKEFLVSHEWKEETAQGAVYPMIIIFLAFNYQTGEVRPSRETFLRALYREKDLSRVNSIH